MFLLSFYLCWIVTKKWDWRVIKMTVFTVWLGLFDREELLLKNATFMVSRLRGISAPDLMACISSAILRSHVVLLERSGESCQGKMLFKLHPTQLYSFKKSLVLLESELSFLALSVRMSSLLCHRGVQRSSQYVQRQSRSQHDLKIIFYSILHTSFHCQQALHITSLSSFGATGDSCWGSASWTSSTGGSKIFN